MQDKLQKILDWQDNKPTTDEQWAEDTKAENLDIKFGKQLNEMQESLEEKVKKVEKDLDKFINWPDAVRYDLTQQFTQMFELQAIDGVVPDAVEGKTLQQWVDEEFADKHTYYKWKVAKINQSVERIKKEKELRASGYLLTDKDEKGKELPDRVPQVAQERVRNLTG